MTDMPTAKQNDIEEWAGLLGVFGFVAGFGVFAYQVYLWLKLGQWTPMPLWTLLEWAKFDFSSLNNIDWLGVQTIIAWVLNLPLSVSLVAIGFALGGAVGYLIGSVRELSQKKVP